MFWPWADKIQAVPSSETFSRNIGTAIPMTVDENVSLQIIDLERR